MSWKRSVSAAALAAAVAAAAGCSGGPTGQADPTGPSAPAPAEAMKERLANQARAIVELGVENDRLQARIDELRAEVARLEAELKARAGSPPAAVPKAESGPRPIPPIGRY